MKRLLANMLLLLAVTVISIAVAEVGLRLLTPFPIHGKKANKVYDRDFGYRLNLHHPTIDKNGFRNRGEKPAVVAAIGDSHTYGSGVKYEEAWPVVFEQLTGVPTYNFGVGSYGIYTYYAIGKRALDSGYKNLIIALYIHNDFTLKGTNCAIDYGSSPFWQNARKLHSLSLPKCKLEDTWRTADAPEIVRRYRGKVQSAILSAWDYLVSKPIEDWWHEKRSAMRNIAEPEKKGKLVADGSSTGKAGLNGAKKPASAYFNARGMAVVKDDLSATDLRNPDTRAAVDDLKKMLLDLDRSSKAKGAQLGLLFITSKEQIIYQYADNKDVYEQEPWLRQMVLNQIEIEREIKRYLEQNGIQWQSVQPDIVSELRRVEKQGGQVFHPGGNHPLPSGFRMYAVAANKLYKKMVKHAANPPALGDRTNSQ